MRTSRTLTALVVLTLTLAAACDGGSEASDPATRAAQPSATATVAPSPTPDPIGSPEVDGDRAYAHVERLALDIGSRVAGTPKEIEARDYAAETLRAYGYDVTFQEFAFDSTRFLPAEVSPNAAPMIGGYGLRGSASGTASGPMRLAGVGAPEDLPPGSMTGAIAVLRRGDVPFGEKVANAVAAGAVGVVIYNNDGTSPIWDLGSSATIPVVGVRQEPGEDLAARLEAGAVEGSVRVYAPNNTAYNVIAKPPGVATCETVTGGHIDSVSGTQAADDNASGSGTVLEVARVMAARDLRGANCFVLFGAEEMGLIGSEQFVAQLTDDEINALQFMINLDVVGIDEPMWLVGDTGMIEVARIEAAELDIDATPGNLPNGLGSDHASFIDAGVPAVFLYRRDELIHTTTDAVDRILPARLEEAASVAVAVLEELAPDEAQPGA